MLSEDRNVVGDEIGVLKVSAATWGRFNPLAHKAVVIPSQIERLSVIPQQDTVIVSRANTSELVGASAYVDKDYPHLYLSDKLWRIRTVAECSAVWLSYVLSSGAIRSRISERATGTSGSMKNISQSAFLAITIPCPPLSEQRKIAQILGTWDAAIARVEQLIAALQLRKKGLMQLLLTGQVRFPEYRHELWQERELSELVEPVTRPDSVNPTSEYRLIGVRWYLEGAHIHTVVPGTNIVSQTLSLVEEGDILYNKMWVSKAAFAVAKREHAGAYGTGEYPQFRAKEGLHVDFLSYAFHSKRFQHEATSLCRGTTGRIRLHPSDFLQLRILVPSLAEQRKIAEFLATVDREITLRKLHLDQLQSQRKGLMQRLLTGQTRVAAEELVHRRDS